MPQLPPDATPETRYTAEQIEAIGGNRWTHPRTGEIRVYLNEWPALVGLEISHYGTGNISGATLNGRPISNRRAGQLAAARVYWANGTIVTDLRAVADNARQDGAALEADLAANIAARVAETTTAG